jgi:hypothetical protein
MIFARHSIITASTPKASMTPISPWFQKNNNLVRVNDYIPISLLNSSIKLITKILPDRLQTVIMKLIHQN